METEQVDGQDPRRRNSEKVAGKPPLSLLADAEAICYWNDKKYSDGATVCDNHRRYECWNGKWAELGDC